MQSKQNIYCIKCHKAMYFTGTVNFYFLNIRGVNQCLNKKCENYWLTNKVYFEGGKIN